MTDEKPEARFDAFTEDERDALHWAVTAGGKRILDDSIAGQLPQDQLDGAAGLFLLLSNFARQLDLFEGRPTLSLDGAVVVAQMIASGEAPQMAAEPIGDHADVPVTPEEDEVYADGCCGCPHDPCEGIAGCEGKA